MNGDRNMKETGCAVELIFLVTRVLQGAQICVLVDLSSYRQPYAS